MPLLSINQLAIFTGKTRATVTKAVDGIPAIHGPKKAKLYDSKVAFEAIYCRRGDEPGSDFVSEAESRRLLNIRRREQIDLEMSIKRKERIPIEILNAVNDDVFQSVAALLKTNKGRSLNEEVINDVMAQFLDIPNRLKW